MEDLSIICADEQPEAASSPVHTTTPFPFLSLPPELRFQVYSLHFAAPFCIEIDLSLPRHPCLKLLDTCRKVRNEASPFYYSLNSFYIIEPLCLSANKFYTTKSPYRHSFLTSLSPTHIALLRNVELDFASKLGGRGFDQDLQNTAAIMDYCFPESEEWVSGVRSRLAGRVSCNLEALACDSRGLETLTLTLPGSLWGDAHTYLFDEGDMFAQFPGIGVALKQIRGVKKLSIGYTLDWKRVGWVAREMGVQHVTMFWRPSDTEGAEYGYQTHWGEVKEQMQEDGWLLEAEPEKWVEAGRKEEDGEWGETVATKVLRKSEGD